LSITMSQFNGKLVWSRMEENWSEGVDRLQRDAVSGCADPLLANFTKAKRYYGDGAPIIALPGSFISYKLILLLISLLHPH
jgi:hypothetical protein